MSCWRKGAGSRRRFCPLTELAGARDIAFCREIAGRANANLLHAARLLPQSRQAFFFASYAAMRLIDDAVDDGFLVRPATDRAAARSEMLAAIDHWEAQCLGRAEEGPLPAPVQRALRRIVRISDLGDTPWRGLAEAMRRDARETPMVEWEDFLAYASGATVAPATIFIYLLAADPSEEGFRWRLPSPPEGYAEDLGIFCYLVHILRDLAKDAERSERLVTIPESLLRRAGIAKTELSEAVKQRDGRISILAADLRERAAAHLVKGRGALAELGPLIGRREYLALKGLIRIYVSLFERFGTDFFEGMAAAPGLETALRAELLVAEAEE
ncbi:squalene/phytoene synthase family protein [Nisaea acidiphila]|uniref:Squalene/phytoene synthase family protein n=1 Tax=Nisaea acidiphila TaxID=1862145 RepID=A0A9J7AR69_9PROT|nr:squalene/phytoene synthase family protein [Nisaea acidiphila]UUX50107.1 squalene/phytoene synthase family protein [Nisaea acidiphila]